MRRWMSSFTTEFFWKRGTPVEKSPVFTEDVELIHILSQRNAIALGQILFKKGREMIFS